MEDPVVLAAVVVLLKLQEVTVVQVELEQLDKVIMVDSPKELELVEFIVAEVVAVALVQQVELMVVELQEEQAELV